MTDELAQDTTNMQLFSHSGSFITRFLEFVRFDKDICDELAQEITYV